MFHRFRRLKFISPAPPRRSARPLSLYGAVLASGFLVILFGAWQARSIHERPASACAELIDPQSAPLNPIVSTLVAPERLVLASADSVERLSEPLDPVVCRRKPSGWSNDGEAPPRVYENRLTRIESPTSLLADHPEFVAPISGVKRFEAPMLVDDEGADLDVRAWRFSYNARGVIEMPNRLKAANTAVIVVHPWGIDDGQGWRTPEPAGVCDFCTPEKNALAGRHTRAVVAPFVKRLRGEVALVMYSLIGGEDPIRKKLYRSINGRPSEADLRQGTQELDARLKSYRYEGQTLPEKFVLSNDRPVADYFRQFSGLDAGAPFNGTGYFQLPVPVCSDLPVHPDDVVFYDEQGYDPLRVFLKQQGVRHVLLAGYATDMCFARTTAGYENLSKDFNVFLVADATLATFPANDSPCHATNAAIAFAALNQLVTQTSWVRLRLCK